MLIPSVKSFSLRKDTKGDENQVCLGIRGQLLLLVYQRYQGAKQNFLPENSSQRNERFTIAIARQPLNRFVCQLQFFADIDTSVWFTFLPQSCKYS